MHESLTIASREAHQAWKDSIARVGAVMNNPKSKNSEIGKAFEDMDAASKLARDTFSAAVVACNPSSPSNEYPWAVERLSKS